MVYSSRIFYDDILSIFFYRVELIIRFSIAEIKKMHLIKIYLRVLLYIIISIVWFTLHVIFFLFFFLVKSYFVLQVYEPVRITVFITERTFNLQIHLHELINTSIMAYKSRYHRAINFHSVNYEFCFGTPMSWNLNTSRWMKKGLKLTLLKFSRFSPTQLYNFRKFSFNSCSFDNVNPTFLEEKSIWN